MTGLNLEVWKVEFDRCSETGRIKGEYWSKDGVPESPPGDRPQTILYDEHGRPTHLKWQKCGQNHRDGGPSWLVINPDTGVHIREHYCVEGRLHRPDRMPAKIHRDPTTGEVEYFAFYENGVQRFWRKINDLALSP